MYQYESWRASNAVVTRWFDEHKAGLARALGREVDTIVLSGSRRWDLSYPESDIDAVVLADDHEDKSLVADSVKAYYDAKGLDAKCISTKAGLNLVTVERYDDEKLPLGHIKLEYTVQTKSQFALILNAGTTGVAKMSLEERATYASNMRKCYLEKDEAGKLALKAWLKVLPEARQHDDLTYSESPKNTCNANKKH